MVFSGLHPTERSGLGIPRLLSNETHFKILTTRAEQEKFVLLGVARWMIICYGSERRLSPSCLVSGLIMMLRMVLAREMAQFGEVPVM